MSYSRPGGKKKPHAADVYAAEQIAQAVGFVVHFRKGPHETYSRNAATLAEARIAEAELNSAHGQFGRRAMVYATSPSGAAFPVPK
jgi:hypothetical protein